MQGAGGYAGPFTESANLDWAGLVDDGAEAKLAVGIEPPRPKGAITSATDHVSLTRADVNPSTEVADLYRAGLVQGIADTQTYLLQQKAKGSI